MPASGLLRCAEPFRFRPRTVTGVDRKAADRRAAHRAQNHDRGVDEERLMMHTLLLLTLMQVQTQENLPSQKLGVDDLVAISVYDSPEFTRTLRVEEDGMIHLPLLKAGVTAAGLLPRQLESSIAVALKLEQI